MHAKAITAVGLAAATVRAAIAPDAPSGILTEMAYPNPYRRQKRAMQAPGGQKESYTWTIGAVVQPGKAVSKTCRQDSRMDSVATMLDAEPVAEDDCSSFTGLFRKLMTAYDERVASRSTEHKHKRWDKAPFEPKERRFVKMRPLISLIIAFLLVFGALYTLVEYLLFESRASAACIPVTTTVYVPVTTTVVYTPSSSPSGQADDRTTTSTIHTTLYSTSTLTNTVTVFSASISAAAVSPSGGATYFYGIESGTTTWLDGLSPSSGALLTTATTSFFVSPVTSLPSAAYDPTTIITSVVTAIETVTPPPYTSTVYSITGPGSTTTSTSTHYTTIQLSYATSSSHYSYPGLGSAGWNMSSSVVVDPAATQAANSTRDSTTLTQIFYWGTGNATTSTSTLFITTTIAAGATITPYSTSFEYSESASIVPLITSFDVAAASATLDPTSPTTSLASNSAANTSSEAMMSFMSSSYSPSAQSTGFASSLPGTNATHFNATSVGATTGRVYGAPSSYAGLTGSTSMPGPALPSPSTPKAMNSSLANGLTAMPLSTGTASNSSIAATTSTIGSTTAIAVPVTMTLSSGSKATVVLETTTTTLGLVGGPTTVSGYFVFNGTTTISYLPGSALGTNVASISGTLTGPDPSAYYRTSHTTLPAPFSSPALSISIPVNASTAALSAISSVVSELTESINSFAFTSSSDRLPSTASAFPFSVGSGANASAASILSSLNVPTALSSSVVTAFTSSSFFSGTQASSAASNSLINTSGVATSSFVTVTSTLRSSNSPPSSPGTSGAAVTASSAPSSSSTRSGLDTSQPSLNSSTTTRASLSSTYSNPFPPSSATATPTACGEHGYFTLTFDNLPNFIPTNQNQTDITQAPPVPNPYNHLTFTNGYVYGPSPRVPFAPVSSPHLAVFLAEGSGMTARSTRPGEIGDGPYESLSAFWFDANSAYLGCDNGGPDDCTLVFTGYTWSPSAQDEIATFSQNATLPLCPGLSNCKLQQVEFPDSFRALSGLQIQAFIGNEQRMFFMDDLALAWSNNTCEAGLTRLRYQ